jgi:hypothetical protein
MAEEMDRLGYGPCRSPFTFFLRTSRELRRAIADMEHPARVAVLRRHLKAIDDRRLRQAMAALLNVHRGQRGKFGLKRGANKVRGRALDVRKGKDWS